jgi:hypothetical protein
MSIMDWKPTRLAETLCPFCGEPECHHGAYIEMDAFGIKHLVLVCRPDDREDSHVPR